MSLFRFAISTLCLSSLLTLNACSKQEETSKDNAIVATTPVTGEASTLTERNALQRLSNTLETNLKNAGVATKVVSIHPTEIKDMYWVVLEDFPSLFVSANGQYVFQGDLMRLGDKKVENITEKLQSISNKVEFDKLNPKDLIIYNAKGKAKHVVYVFTDASCPYCHKFHEQMDDINNKGIEVRYIAWPRGEQFFPTMEGVWCSDDRKAALDAAFVSAQMTANNCKNPVMDQYKLGHKIGVNGTPAIYSDSGQYLGGYLSTQELLEKLQSK